VAALAPLHRHSAPTAQDASLARVSGQSLSRFARRQEPLTLKVKEAGQEQPIELPAGAVVILMEVLEAMAAGRGVTIIPENAELTTVEAARILNVSRPYLIKLLDEKVIPHRLVGKHRRILIDDVMAYKKRIDAAREEVLAQLTAEAQEDDMGYSRRP
jgi:excisionase family DNA binding protein